MHASTHIDKTHMEDGVLLRSYIRVGDVPLNIPGYAHTENCKTKAVEFIDFLRSH